MTNAKPYGKDAEFDVTVNLVEAAEKVEINDETATKLGLESADRLREVVREQIESEYGGMTRQKVKRQLLDELDKLYQMESPEKLVETDILHSQPNRFFCLAFLNSLSHYQNEQIGTSIFCL